MNHLSWIQCTVYRIQYTGSWLCHVLNKCSQCVCTFAKSREFSSFEICKGFHLYPLYCLVFGLFCFYKTSWKAKYNIFVSLLWTAFSLCTFQISVLSSIWFPSAGHTWSSSEWKANVKTNLFLDFVTAGSLVHLNTRGHHNCQIYFKSNSNQTEKFTFDKIN